MGTQDPEGHPGTGDVAAPTVTLLCRRWTVAPLWDKQWENQGETGDGEPS